MASEVSDSKKRKKVSMNKKKNWRKHSRMDDVEDLMEEERLQERTGGKVAEKKNDQLFFIDASKTKPTTTTKRSKQDLSELKCYSNLKVTESIPQTTKRREKLDERRVEKKSKVLEQRKTDIKEKRTTQAAARKTRFKGLWGAEAEEEPPQHEKIHHMRVTRQLRVLRRQSMARPTSKLPAIEIPHPGASYNPEANAFCALLRTANEVEVQKEKAAAKLKRQMEDKFPTKDEAPTEESYFTEMSVGISTTADSSDESDGWEGATRSNPPVTTDKKKTPNIRRKERSNQKEEHKAKKVKESTVKEKAVYRLRSIKAELDANEKEYADRAWRKASKAAEAEYHPKKLGKLKYEEPEIEIKLSGELVGSLRQLKWEGDLLADRFKSLQRRNVIETRERQKHKRKYRKKKYEKKDHKKITE